MACRLHYAADVGKRHDRDRPLDRAPCSLIAAYSATNDDKAASGGPPGERPLHCKPGEGMYLSSPALTDQGAGRVGLSPIHFADFLDSQVLALMKFLVPNAVCGAITNAGRCKSVALSP